MALSFDGLENLTDEDREMIAIYHKTSAVRPAAAPLILMYSFEFGWGSLGDETISRRSTSMRKNEW